MRSTICVLAFTLTACGSPDSVVCGDGTTEADGVCTADPVDDPAPPTLDDVLAELPACTSTTGNGQIDLTTSCAGGVCAGMSYSEIVDVLGEGTCEGYGTFWFCDWSVGITALVSGDELAPFPEDVPYSIDLDERYKGTTSDGLGVGFQFACFLDALPKPDAVYFTLIGARFAPDDLSWFGAPNFSVEDRVGAGKDGNNPDGLVDSLTLRKPYTGSAAQ